MTRARPKFRGRSCSPSTRCAPCRRSFVRSLAWVDVDGIGTPRRRRRGTRCRPRRSEPRSRAAGFDRCVRGCRRTTAPSPASRPWRCRRHRMPCASGGSQTDTRSRHGCGELPCGTARRRQRSTPPSADSAGNVGPHAYRGGRRLPPKLTETRRLDPPPVGGTSPRSRSHRIARGLLYARRPFSSPVCGRAPRASGRGPGASFVGRRSLLRRRSEGLAARSFAVKPSAAYGRPGSAQAASRRLLRDFRHAVASLPYFAPKFSPPPPFGLHCTLPS
jgi:hypothetical protein